MEVAAEPYWTPRAESGQMVGKGNLRDCASEASRFARLLYRALLRPFRPVRPGFIYAK